ncbi:MAG: hypothetical protein ABIO46_15505 [Chitinophagales bacterium]
MKNFIFPLFLFAVIFSSMPFLQSCNEKARAKENLNDVNTTANEIQDPVILSEEFKKYWYAGKAELSSYHLKQARYGEIHDGDAVTIFVTEDFSKSKQVKLDHPETAGDDRLPVFKLNLVKKFNTGIYPYSMMLSVFSPVDLNNYPAALKVTANVQEWCGITFTQINQQGSKYHVAWNSYFEDEGDHDKTFENCIAEDELWNLIRIAPDRLPTGEKKLLPGSLYTRMTHIPMGVQTANLSVKDDGSDRIYTIDYTSQKHTLNIRFENYFPYKIMGWEETFPGFDGKLLTTTATLNKTILSDYWIHHNNDDRGMRKELGLPENY